MRPPRTANQSEAESQSKGFRREMIGVESMAIWSRLLANQITNNESIHPTPPKKIKPSTGVYRVCTELFR